MRQERRIRIVRRFVLGLAVAAFVAPAAQARVDESGTAQRTLSSGGALVIQGDDKVIATKGGGATAAVIHGDDKVLAPRGDGILVGDDKVIVPRSDGILVGDDKVIVPEPGAYTVEAVRSPSGFDWGDALVGASTAFALMLLAGGAALGARRARPAAA